MTLLLLSLQINAGSYFLYTRTKRNESTLCYVLGNDQILLDLCLICTAWLVLGRRACTATLSFMGFLFLLLFISVLKLQTKIFLAAKHKVLEAIPEYKLIHHDCRL